MRDTSTEGLTRMISCQHRALENLREQHKKELDHIESTLSLDLQEEKKNQVIGASERPCLVMAR